MAKVEFTRVETNDDVENIDIKDGRFIVTGEGKAFVDYGENRIGIGGTPDTQMSDSSTNSVENRVIKGYVDNEITGAETYADGKVVNTLGTATDKAYSQSFINNLNTYSETEHRVGTWIDGKPLYSRWFSTTITGTPSSGVKTIMNITRSDYGVIWVNNYFSQNNMGSIIGAYYTGATDMQRTWIEGGNYVAWQGGTSYPPLPATLYYELRYTKSTD